jgi:hypothetical protein
MHDDRRADQDNGRKMPKISSMTSTRMKITHGVGLIPFSKPAAISATSYRRLRGAHLGYGLRYRDLPAVVQFPGAGVVAVEAA